LNVSTLLREPVGSRRTIPIDEEPVAVPAEGWRSSVWGELRLIRTQRGLLVRASLTSTPRLECSRCLEPYSREVELDFEEEFVVRYDPVTGAPIEGVEDQDFEVDERNHLDLDEAVRQYELTALPLQPLCRPGCKGLCPQCGRNLNEGECGCVAAGADGRWAALAGLADRLHVEEQGDGGTEA
jgi:uncharacterized protein